MPEILTLTATTKTDRYVELLPQIKSLVADEPNRIANMANIAAALKEAFGFFWVGFYCVEDAQLVLAPFQGPIACTRIAKGKGVCGTAWANAETIIVPDVDAFPGHIACSSAARSEIVVPIFDQEKKIVAVLDVDSDTLNSFDEVDKQYLEQISVIINYSS